MSTPVVTQGTTINCPHAIPGTILATGAKVLIDGTPVAVDGNTGTVAGCPFTTPGGTPQPCTTAEFTLKASKVKVGGSFVLLVNPSDLCKSGQIPNGPVVWAGPQSVVLAR